MASDRPGFGFPCVVALLAIASTIVPGWFFSDVICRGVTPDETLAAATRAVEYGRWLQLAPVALSLAFLGLGLTRLLRNRATGSAFLAASSGLCAWLGVFAYVDAYRWLLAVPVMLLACAAAAHSARRADLRSAAFFLSATSALGFVANAVAWALFAHFKDC